MILEKIIKWFFKKSMEYRYFLRIVIFLSSAILLFPGIVGFSDASKIPAGHSKYSQVKAFQSSRNLVLHSASALVEDQLTGECFVQKQAEAIMPIASITKLMTAMIVLDAKLDLEESITIESEDVDTIRHSRSRLPVNTRITRGDALLLALMASENRAAHALGRTYPGGLHAFTSAMNAKAKSLGLNDTRFIDPAGIHCGNVSSAKDLARMVDAAYQYSIIREYTTCKETSIRAGRRILQFHNTNRLVGNPRWQIGLSKTGFIDEAGRCLVMQSQVAKRSVLIVLLDAQGKLTRYGDANRIKQWMEGSKSPRQKNRG
jgi:D-alanyl-D-alanine endopeptidase (penicillin-binding protein 7)